MSTTEAVFPGISSPDLSAGQAELATRPAPAPVRDRVGRCSLRQIVDGAVAEAESEVIRRALTATLGNKSQAARLLQTNYTTLHAKMKRYGISAREFRV